MRRWTKSPARGAEAHLLQPGLGWVSWWQSKIYPQAKLEFVDRGVR